MGENVTHDDGWKQQFRLTWDEIEAGYTIVNGKDPESPQKHFVFWDPKRSPLVDGD